MPTGPEALVLVINLDVAEALGLDLDPALVERAKVLVSGGTVTKK